MNELYLPGMILDGFVFPEAGCRFRGTQGRPKRLIPEPMMSDEKRAPQQWLMKEEEE
ncbi:MAG: hypothetical protein IKS31_09050 [Clostridia bacterium]|nr:hypothetical protein [Clostridia bacterium]MBR4459091.1 hypothetical protein [Clostridia bacterium]